MTPSEVLEMRNQLAEEYISSTLGREVTGFELADWLIETGWITGVPSEDSD